MRYSLQSQYYSDFNTIEVNRLTPRSYFIPYPSREAQKDIALTQKRYGSQMVQCLNGSWDFRFYADPKQLPLELDTDKVDFRKLDVPSCWQYRGIADPMYLNVRYPFAYKPPVIPTTEPVGRYFSAMDGFKKAPEKEMNYVGLYRTFFDVEDLSKVYEISFLGVCSCLELHVNGRFVGYSEESHNTAEFDLSDYVVKGRNELVCVVRRWCNSTYLECQDMFRNNGIFRDVLLRVSPKNRIWDIDFSVFQENGKYCSKASAMVVGTCEVNFTLSGHGLCKCEKKTVSQGVCEVVFKDLDVLEWTAETPNLYDLYFETSDSCIHQRVGFKTIEVKGNRYLLNGKLVKFKGVNHHDTDSKNGYCMTAQQIERDLLVCKRFNIDTVRTSHYAPDPLLIELAAELGIYIVDEVDLETHGVFAMKLPPSYNRISNDRKWMSHYVSRTKRHYNRDKVLATPIVMWSLGNESGGGCNTDATYDFFRSVSSIPVHYESEIYTKRKAYDIASRMYPPVSELHDIGEGKCKTPQFMDRPYFMCEYAHAMGVGPGNIEGYWKEIYRYDSLIGGCVWEMVDHSVEHEDGSYTYGGDHGEWIHDGNFCCDGLFYPDRTPSTGAWIVRHAYRPIRISRICDSQFDVFNTTAFTDGSAYRMRIRISNGVCLDYVPQAGPLSHETVTFELGDLSGDCFMDVDTFDKDGNKVSTEQICLNESIAQSVEKTEELPSWFALQEGLPVLAAGDSVVTASDPYTILFRAQTDNDSINFVLRPMKKWYAQSSQLIGCRQTAGMAAAQWSITVKGKRFLCSDTYEGCKMPDGKSAVVVTSVIHPLRVKGKLPRFAKAFRFETQFGRVSYFARSGESYVDMKEQFPVSHCDALVSEMTEPNIKPQESGNRCDARFAEISDGKTCVRFDALDKPFELSVKPYSDVELTRMNHRCDEKTSGTYVTINAFQQGIGTGSCGPYTLDEHCYDASKDYVLRFVISMEDYNG
ncbi:MAG: hypothetical protein MJ057_08780 [Sphaerochaetaceae bacterium]|nr:hypothetical protein [Sphaerochaetaceae bacterium]